MALKDSLALALSVESLQCSASKRYHGQMVPHRLTKISNEVVNLDQNCIYVRIDSIESSILRIYVDCGRPMRRFGSISRTDLQRDFSL